MNPSNIPSPDEVKGRILKKAEPFRVQALRVISGIGFVLIALGSIEVQGLQHFLPDAIAAWFIPIGAALAGLKQLLLILGDFLDNYKMDKSFKLGGWMIVLCGISMMLFSSCAIQFTEDGCILANRRMTNGSTYLVGPCVGPDTDGDGNADVNRFRAQWQNEQGQVLRATYWTNVDLPTLIEYQISPGLWATWSAKSGVVVDFVPPEVVEKEPVEVEPAALTTALQ